MRVPAAATLYDRFQIARFARLLKQDRQYSLYQLDRTGYRQALEQSITLDQILAFLSQVTGNRVPLAVVEAIRNWDRQTGAVKLEHLVVLRVNHSDIQSELLNHPQIGPLLGQSMGPKTILVPEKNVKPLKKLLQDNGYFPD